jgi:homoserine O-succinyltransferase
LQTQAILEEHRDRIIQAIQANSKLPDFPEALILERLHNTWHDTGEAVINNWIGKVYQFTNSDRKLPFMDGIDPSNPLGL